MQQRLKALTNRCAALRGAALALVLLMLAAALTLCNRGWSKFYTGSWDGYSELLAVGRITQIQQGQSAPGGFLGVYTQEWGDGEGYQLLKDNAAVSAEAYKSYVHQSGLQGTLLGFADRALLPVVKNGEWRLNALYFLNCTLFYALAFYLCVSMGRRFGLCAGAGAAAAVVFAPWLTTGAKNLYWVLWTWLLPAAAVAAQAQIYRVQGRFSRRWRALLFAAVLARCLCGFEYLSTLLILCEIPLALGWLDNQGARLPWFWEMFRTGLLSLAGAACALGAWLGQCVRYYGNWAEAVDAVAGTVLARAGAQAVAGDAASALTAELSAGEVVRQFLTDGTVLLQFGPVKLTILPLMVAVCGLLLFGVLCLAWKGHCGNAASFRQKMKDGPALALFWGLANGATVSWMVLAKGHAALHTHLTPILWHFAAVPASAAFIACCAGKAAAWAAKKILSKENRG